MLQAVPDIIDKSKIRALIPHSGAMCLIDTVRTWSPQSITCTAAIQSAENNPLRRRGRLGSACGIEYAAQAMALHGALSAGNTGTPRAGALASVRETRFHALELQGDQLTIVATLLLSEGPRVIYQFVVSSEQQILIEGRAAVVLGPPVKNSPASDLANP